MDAVDSRSLGVAVATAAPSRHETPARMILRWITLTWKPLFNVVCVPDAAGPVLMGPDFYET